MEKNENIINKSNATKKLFKEKIYYKNWRWVISTKELKFEKDFLRTPNSYLLVENCKRIKIK